MGKLVKPDREPDVVYYSSSFWIEEKIELFTHPVGDKLFEIKLEDGQIYHLDECGMWNVSLAKEAFKEVINEIFEKEVLS